MRMCLLAVVMAVTLAVGPEYTLHPSDQVIVHIFGLTPDTQTVAVAPDGSITLPLTGRVDVTGKTTDGVARAIAKALHRYMINPDVTVSLATLGTANVLVLGNVKTPGKYALRPNARLTDAIAAAGGLGVTNGAFPTARVSDSTGGSATTISLDQLLRAGDLTQNVALSNDAVVYVTGPVMFTVHVLGAVDKPGDVDVAAGDHLTAAIARAGASATASSDLRHITITRRLPDGTSTMQTVDLYRQLLHGNGDADVELEKGDIVYVPQAAHTGQNNSSTFLTVLALLRRAILF
jgi:polysaccharide export outer membrane protein